MEGQAEIEQIGVKAYSSVYCPLVVHIMGITFMFVNINLSSSK